MALTNLAHRLVRQHFGEGLGKDSAKGLNDGLRNNSETLAIDATCGNGHDTEFLARLGFDQVIGFDVQEVAISHTQNRITKAGLDKVSGGNVSLIHRGHQHLEEYICGTLCCVMFNFGYLPKADKSVTTHSDTSVAALSSALKHLDKRGIICLICYPGHQEGAIETKAIQTWLANIESSLDPKWQVEQHLSVSPTATTPVLYTITQRII